MNDKPPSTSGTGNASLIARIKRAISGEPWSRDEIQEVLQNAQVDLDADEKRMLEGVLDVSETQVRDVMIPRSQMVVIDINEPFEDILKTIVESGHSRFPVIGEDRDEVLGILLAKDLLRHFGSDEAKDVSIRRLLRTASVIPESKRLNALLKEFRASHNHMAIVVDEYGGVEGIVTLEDVLEEIVGEIDDESDRPRKDILRRDDGSLIVKGTADLRKISSALGIAWEPEEDVTTVGGLVAENLERIPVAGDSITWHEYTITVLRADRQRARVLRINALQ